MGKDNLLIGTARGKLGDVVFYRTGGEQRFRARVRPTNPRTNAQLLQRVVVSTAVKAYSQFASICDHAFQNFEGKLKNHQRYMRLNIKMLREIALGDVKSWSPIQFYNASSINWNRKDEISACINPYIISEGDLQSIEPSFAEFGGSGRYRVVLMDFTGFSTETITYNDFINKMGLKAGDQLTFVFQSSDKNDGLVSHTYISRIILMPANGELDDAMFVNNDGTLSLNSPNPENYGDIYFTTPKLDETTVLVVRPVVEQSRENALASVGIIVSRYEDGMWRRSNTQMIVKDSIENKRTIEEAINSFKRAETSSLYLNQADTSIEEIAMYQEKTLENNQEIQIQQENTTRRKEKK